MEIRAIREADYETVQRLLVGNEFRKRVAEPLHFRELIAGAQRALVAVESNEVVGFVRAITDGVSNGYVSMLVVAEKHRRRGVGRALMAAVMGNDPGMTWVLRSTKPAARAFYAKLGFAPSTAALERLRAKPDA